MVEKLQKEIKSILAELKWSQKRLAREIHYERYEIEDPEQLKRDEEKIRKSLSRPTTKIELLESYLGFIREHHEFLSLDKVIPFYQESGVLSETMELEMKNISQELGSE